MNIIELQDYLQNLKINITAREIAKIWGMDETSFSKKKKIGSQIKHKNIEQLENKLGITIITPSEIPNEYNNALQYVKDGMPVGSDTVSMDYYPTVFGSCGSGSFVFSEEKEKLQVPCRLVQNYSKFKKYSVINATGDSMTPHILDRDRLIIEHYDGGQIRDNRIYIFRFYDNIFVKRLVLNLDQIIVISDNEKYQQRIIERSEADNFEIIGRIVGIIRTEY